VIVSCGDALSTMLCFAKPGEESLFGPEDAWKQFRYLWGIFRAISPYLDRSLRGEKPGNIPLEHLAVVADAATTPYQASKRADLQPGDNVIIIGVTGGVGVYMAQTAKALGAKTVIGIARNPQKLQRALKYGADL